MEKPSERLKRKVLVENLWIYVLSEMSKGDIYGLEIRSRVRKDFGFWIGNVTAYKVLYLLEKGGYVSSYKDGARVIYKITSRGMRELKTSKQFLKKIARQITK